MVKKVKEEEHAGGESGTGRWMLTYLDMITLLFGVFIILLAMSTVDKGKYESVIESLKMGFQGGRTIFPGPKTGGQTINDNLNPVGSTKRRIHEYLNRVIIPEADRDMLRFTETERGIQITLFGDMFFESGSSEIKKEMRETLSKITPVLRDVGYYLAFEGHTDERSVSLLTGKRQGINDNWELAAMRAINVLRFYESSGVASEKMAATSYGKYRPVVDTLKQDGHDTPEYRAFNRSVTILIETGSPFKKKTESQPAENWND